MSVNPANFWGIKYGRYTIIPGIRDNIGLARTWIPLFHDDQHGTAVITLAADKCFEIIDKEKIRYYKGGDIRAGSARYSVFKILRADCNDSLGSIYKGYLQRENGVRKQSLQKRKINKSQSKRTAKHSCRGN